MDRTQILKGLTDEWKRLIKEKQPTFEIKKQISLFHLDGYNEGNIEVDVFVSAAKDACESCKKLSQGVYTLDEAYSQMHVPNKHCSKPGGCRCCFVARGKRNAEGRLIFKKAKDNREK